MPSSSRWCPTPEQVMILEEMYRGGIRNPNASQIQKITAHLSLYGKIEGKNVFYWFQNHKARDRQKLRRKLISQQQQQNHHHPHLHHLLPYLESPPPPPPPPPPPQLSHYNPVGSPLQPQGGLNTWKDVDDHLVDQRCEMGKSVFTGSSYGSDWMMTMLDVGPTPLLPPCCNNKPLKTLELFPITSTGLNDKCNNSLHI